MLAKEAPNETWRIRGLTVTYKGRHASVRALRDVDITLRPGRITAVVGESGSGKTTLARTILGVLPASALVTYRERRLPARVAFVQQEAAASLHPLLSVGEQITDIIVAHRKEKGTPVPRRVAKAHARAMMERLGLSPAAAFDRRFPHQLSGGQAQRVGLARALALQAQMLVADEPTSHLDLLTQAEAVKSIRDVTRQHGIATLFITHRLAIVGDIADNVAVLHDGKIVEYGTVANVWVRPRHPYTQSLLMEMARF